MSVTAEMLAMLPSIKSPRNRFFNWSVLKIDGDDLDPVLLIAFISLLTIGVIMVASSSISVADRNFSNPFYYLQRQLLFVAIGLVAALTVFKIRLVQWEKSGMALLLFALFLLVLSTGLERGQPVNDSSLVIILNQSLISGVVVLALLFLLGGRVAVLLRAQ